MSFIYTVNGANKRQIMTYSLTICMSWEDFAYNPRDGLEGRRKTAPKGNISTKNVQKNCEKFNLLRTIWFQRWPQYNFAGEILTWNHIWGRKFVGMLVGGLAFKLLWHELEHLKFYKDLPRGPAGLTPWRVGDPGWSTPSPLAGRATLALPLM